MDGLWANFLTVFRVEVVAVVSLGLLAPFEDFFCLLEPPRPLRPTTVPLPVVVVVVVVGT